MAKFLFLAGYNQLWSCALIAASALSKVRTKFDLKSQFKSQNGVELNGDPSLARPQ
jgi:hypothetical protein